MINLLFGIGAGFIVRDWTAVFVFPACTAVFDCVRVLYLAYKARRVPSRKEVERNFGELGVHDVPEDAITMMQDLDRETWDGYFNQFPIHVILRQTFVQAYLLALAPCAAIAACRFLLF